MMIDYSKDIIKDSNEFRDSKLKKDVLSKLLQDIFPEDTLNLIEVNEINIEFQIFVDLIKLGIPEIPSNFAPIIWDEKLKQGKILNLYESQITESYNNELELRKQDAIDSGEKIIKYLSNRFSRELPNDLNLRPMILSSALGMSRFPLDLTYLDQKTKTYNKLCLKEVNTIITTARNNKRFKLSCGLMEQINSLEYYDFIEGSDNYVDCWAPKKYRYGVAEVLIYIPNEFRRKLFMLGL